MTRKTIGGVEFDDPYAHLHADTSEALAWQWQQDEVARAAAQASPNFAPVRDLLLSQRPGERFQFSPAKAGGRWFSTGPHHGCVALLVQDELGGDGRIIAKDSEVAAHVGAASAVLVSVAPSPRGRYVAVAVLPEGNSVGPWAIYEVATGRFVMATPRAMHIHAQPGWLPDESGFWLAGHNEQGLHRLRFYPVDSQAPGREDVVLQPSLVGPTHPGLTTQVSPDGRHAILVTEMHEHIARAILDLESLEVGPFVPEDWTGECDGSWLDADTYVARVNGDAPRGRVVAIPIRTSTDRSSWRELVAEGEGFLNWAGIVAGRLYVGDMLDASQGVRVFDTAGNLIESLALPQPCSLPSMSIWRAIRPTEEFAFTHTTFTQSSAMMLHNAKTGGLTRVRAPGVELEGVTAERRFATSTDGTRVPYFVVRRDDVDKASPQPCLVSGYGGFNLSLLPAFPTEQAPFIEAGGIYVQACLRGGGEYGPAWHDGGRLFHKQNTFDDLAAVAQDLIARGVSTPAQMAFQGLSNGGLLAGVAIVQQPHLWRAVAPVVPLLDMMEPWPIVPETAVPRAVFADDYGDVNSDPEIARYVFGYSPYHNIKPGVAYPAVYQVFGENDPGCPPFHGRKFTACLREADNGGRPIHLRVWRNTGHGMLDPASAANFTAEWLAFLMDHVGLRYQHG